MSHYRRASGGRRDTAEPAIIERLQMLGASVVQLSGTDVPDLAVGFRGITALAEVKTGKAKRQKGQETLAKLWRGAPVALLRTPEDAQAWLFSLCGEE